MTFKHDNFSSSEVMRSLERLAVQNGMMKPEQFVKQATIKTCDISPTGNLMENVIKLCAGLRDQGLTKQAQELEANFLTYKQAQTLYQAHKETGEDLIESAHPEGSHKLRDVDSDEATFEDILEQHVKSLQMVNKTPKGKLSSAALINKVKTVLAEVSVVDLKSMDDANLNKLVDSYLSTLMTDLAGIQKHSSSLTLPLTPWINEIRQLANAPSIVNVKKIQSELARLRTRLDPQAWMNYVPLVRTGLSDDDWARIEIFLNDADKNVANALLAITEAVSKESKDDFNNRLGNITSIQKTQTDPLLEKGKALKDRIQAIALGRGGNIPAVKNWVTKQNVSIDDLTARFSKLPSSQVATYRTGFDTEMSQLEKDTDDAETQIAQEIAKLKA